MKVTLLDKFSIWLFGFLGAWAFAGLKQAAEYQSSGA